MSVDQLPILAGQATEFHRAARRAGQEAVLYAFLAGAALQTAKDIMPHGAFRKWLRDDVKEISKSSAHRYEVFFNELKAKCPTVGHLIEDVAGGSLAKLPDPKRAAILGAIHEGCGGKNLTELYRDFGVIRDPLAKKYHPPHRPTTEKLARTKRDSEELIKLLIGYIRSIKEEHLTLIDDPLRNALLESCVELNNTIRKMAKRS